MSNITPLSIEELHQKELELLEAFDAFCSEHGLRYSLTAGTLLGAIRHKGFIPWDDDIDVCMPRPDYDRLATLAGELPAGLRLVGPENARLFTPGASSAPKVLELKSLPMKGSWIKCSG